MFDRKNLAHTFFRLELFGFTICFGCIFMKLSKADGVIEIKRFLFFELKTLQLIDFGVQLFVLVEEARIRELLFRH